jgi:hypothetical protein
VLWVLDCLDDIRSDLSVLHRIDDMDTMPAPRFWAYATRLVHYSGAVAGQALLEQRAAQPAGQPAAARRQAAEPEADFELWQHSPEIPAGANVVDSNFAVLGNQPGMSQIASHSYAPAT